MSMAVLRSGLCSAPLELSGSFRACFPRTCFFFKHLYRLETALVFTAVWTTNTSPSLGPGSCQNNLAKMAHGCTWYVNRSVVDESIPSIVQPTSSTEEHLWFLLSGSNLTAGKCQAAKPWTSSFAPHPSRPRVARKTMGTHSSLESREPRHLPLGWSSKQLICSQTPIGGPGHSKMHQENFTNTFKTC